MEPQQTPWVALLLLFAATSLDAQIRSPGAGQVVMGHHHVVTADTVSQRRFWIDGMGASQTKLGNSTVFKLPDLLVMLRVGEPNGGMDGTTVPEITLHVKDVTRIAERLNSLGFRSLERPRTPEAFVLMEGPDGMRIALAEHPGRGGTVENGSITLSGPDPDVMRDWYLRAFNADPVPGDARAVDLGGVRLRFLASGGAVGTRGRVLDHIGFEVGELESFTKDLVERGVSLDQPYRVASAISLGLAFLTDPWGTYIELTEGLDRL